MKKNSKKNFCVAMIFILTFILWTVAVRFIDVKAIGPLNSSVGFAIINGFFRDIIGVNFTLYTITDWLGLVPIGVCFGFGILGFCQWIKRKKILKVDKDILLLGVFYIAVMGVYILFEYVTINHRPVLINGYLETSYPSSTTMLVMCVMPTAIMQFNRRIKNVIFRKCVGITLTLFTAFMVIGRIISGVHWITDIIGGGLISTGLMVMYSYLCGVNFT